MSMRRAATLALIAAWGCDAARADDVTPRDPVPAEASPRDGSRPEASVEPSATAEAPPAEPAVDDRAATAPSRAMPRTTALMLDSRARVGVTLGHPPGFLLDNPSLILMWQRGEGPRKIVIKRLGGAGLDEPHRATLLASAEAVGLAQARFGDFEEAVAGPKRWPAQIAAATGRGLGDGAPREALAIVIDVPGLEAIGVIGAWPAGDEGAETVLDVVRHLQRCRVVVGSGCVADDP